MKKKATIAVVTLVLTACLAIGGTLAWLVDSTESVTNTFTYGDIDIDLWEHKLKEDGLTLGIEKVYEETGFKMIPGNTIEKDPTITVDADSEACWLFVKVEESDNFDSFMTYSIATDWTALEVEGVKGVYYREVEATDTDTDINILGAGSVTIDEKEYTWADKEVFVLPTVTKEMLNVDFQAPTLTFTAYAVQRDANISTAEQAWTIALAD